MARAAPFSFDVDTLAGRLQTEVPSPVWTPWRVRRYRAWAMTFFKNVGNDQWLPLADYYQLPKRGIARQVTAAIRV